MKRLILVLGVSVALLGSGVAAAGMLPAGPSPSASTKEKPHQAQKNRSDDGGIHGGSISRLHTKSVCNLVDISTLSGNWTHGDYVSKVRAARDSAVPIAAHSDCGKPVVAVGHRHGPPDFVPQKVKPRQRASGKPEMPGS